MIFNSLQQSLWSGKDWKRLELEGAQTIAADYLQTISHSLMHSVILQNQEKLENLPFTILSDIYILFLLPHHVADLNQIKQDTLLIRKLVSI